MVFGAVIVSICNIPAQVPAITGFTPASGPTGGAGSTTVTIAGTNFSATAANNTVMFGAVRATVSAATETQLTVTVPFGATWQPLSVMVGGLTAYSYSVANPFIPTFDSKNTIDISDFALKVDFATGSHPYFVAIGDLDGDGKLDLAVANNSSASVSVFRNTYTAGIIDAGCFAAKVDFTTGENPRSLAIGDLDGDGKPDLVVVNSNSASVSIFRNTSIVGTIDAGSFAAKVDFTTGTLPRSVAIGDLDGDGKPDLAVANYSSASVSVFRNTSTAGTIDVGSFAAKVDFTTGSYPQSVAIGDLDGDGKPDLVTANNSSSSVSVFRNTSMAGTIDAGSFAAKVDFTVGAESYSVAIGDLDGDGKPDLVTVNSPLSSAVSILRNISTAGIINSGSFAAKVDFTTGDIYFSTDPYSVAIGDLDGDGKPDLAVANYSSSYSSVSVFRNTSTVHNINTGSFAAKVYFAAGANPYSVAIGDLDGDGKPDLVTANSGNSTISVLSSILGITGFTPASGPTGSAGSTIVTIQGTNFSATAANNTVMFGAVRATVSAATETQLTVTAPFGATWQPLSVTVGGLTAYSYSVANPFIPTFDSKHAILPCDFAAKVDFTTGTAPYSVAIGDLDGDGKPDLAVANNSSASVSVFRNTSTTGTIDAGSFAVKVDFTTGTNPSSVAIGDLDGDGKPDLAVANYGDNTVSVFRNTSTAGAIDAGSFAAKVDFVTGTNPSSVAIGNLNEDGKPDLAVANYSSNKVSIFRNTSTSGTIDTGSFAVKVDFTTGIGPKSVAIGDLDGDGRSDLATANYGDNTVSVLRRSSSFVGSFSYNSFESVSFTTGSYPYSVAIGDLDGDGKPDLAVANYISNTVSVFRNTSVVGAISTGSFATKVDFPTGAAPYSVAIGDLDGDGKPDLATANYYSTSVSAFRNTSTSGTISTGSFAAKVDFAVGKYPYCVVIGDLDGDGKPNLVVANSAVNTVSVLTAVLVPTITGFTPASGSTGSAGSTTVTIQGTNFSATAANNTVMFGAVRATVLVATDTQLTVTAPFGATWQPLSVMVGGFTAYSYSVTNPFIPTFDSKNKIEPNDFAARVGFTTKSKPYSVAIGDLDGDGKPDLAVANYNSSSVSVFRNTSIIGTISTESFSAKVDFPTENGSYSVAIGDLNGDGKPDLAVANSGSNTVSVFQNTSIVGTVSFDYRIVFTTGSEPYSVAIGDLDGDGKPDLAVANSGSNTVSVFRNTFVGTINAGSFSAKVDFTTGDGSYCVAIGDLDGDGKPDLATANYDAGSVSVFRNTSIVGTINAGSFSAKVDLSAGGGAYCVAIGDLDGDGKPDLATVRYGNKVSVFRNTSTIGTISTGSFSTKVDFPTGTAPYSVAIGDLDGDGKPDLAVANYSSGSVSVFRNTSTVGVISTGSFDPKVDFTTGTNPYCVAIGDLDGDGKPNLVVANSGDNTVSVLSRPPVITGFTPASGPTGSEGSTTVTVTGSNFSATAANNTVMFGAVRATVSAATETQLTVTAPFGATWQPLSVTVGGLTAYSYSVANPFIPTFDSKNTILPCDFAAKVDFATGTFPSFVAIGDLDGDGKPDLAVANYSSATVSVLLNTSTAGTIDAGSFAAKVDFTTGTNPYCVAIGDLDGDGKPDLAVANYTSSTVSVFRNTSTSGTVSFAAKFDFTTGTNPQSVAIGDLDGDGKPDLAVTNSGSATVSVFRNTSTSGTVSFSAKVDFIMGTNPKSVAIGDLDGDGKPDLAVTSSDMVSIFRNTSTSGSINLGSFSAKVDFATGTNPRSVVIGDLDGDGKPDLAVANVSSGTASVFRNTSTAGTIDAGSFAAKVDFTTGVGSYSVAIGDLDGDGKPDLAVANNFSYSVCVLRNTSTAGTVSFSYKVDFAVGKSPYWVVIGDLDGDGKPSLVTANSGDNTVSVLTAIQVPTITGFTPASGSTGGAGSTTVKIHGFYFSATAANNTVMFGAVRATVLAATETQLTVTAPFGATWQPLSVTVGGLTAYSYSVTNPFIPTFDSKNTIDKYDFAARVDFTTGTTPLFVAIGDLDGDGKPDLAISNSGANTVSVLLNTSGGMVNFDAKVDFSVGTYPDGIAIGDLDRDGKPDLAVANYNSNTVSVLRNTSIAGTVSFDPKVDFTTGNKPKSVAIGDLDGDGKPDLAIANFASSTVSVFRNTSIVGTIDAGSFAAKVDFSAGGGSSGIAIGDLDGDGKPDLASASSNMVSVFRNTSVVGAIGTGSFASRVTFATGTYAYSVAIGDLDGDGKPDLAVANYSATTISVLRNTSTVGTIGTGSFAAKVDFTTGPNPCGVSIGDLDGDGKPDLAVINYNTNTVSAFRNTSLVGTIDAGSFAAKVDYALSAFYPTSVNIGDLDGNGKPDLVVTNGQHWVSVLGLAVIPTITGFTAASGPTGGAGSTTVTVTGTNFSATAANNTVMFGAVRATVLAATETQLTVTAPFGATWQPLSVTVGGLTAYSYSVANPFIPTFDSKNTIEPLDFADKVDLATGTGSYVVAIGDLDGDGKPDLAFANYNFSKVYVFRNISTTGTIDAGSFSAKVEFTAGSSCYSLAIGDLDGDGKPDLAVANYSSSTVSVLLNTSTVGTVSFATKVDYATGSNPYSVAIGDLDGDGKPDLAVACSGNARVCVFRNKSTAGTVSFDSRVDFITGANPQSVAIGDLDGDGKPDLAVANYTSSTVSVFRNTSAVGYIGSGSFAAKVDFTAGTGSSGIAIGDLDGDGKPDLAVANYTSSTVSVYRNTSTAGTIDAGSFSAKVDFATGTNPKSVAIGDLDGDGKPDLAVANYTSSTVSAFRNTSTSGAIDTGSFAAKVDFATGTNPWGVAIGDLDGDGKPSLVVANSGNFNVSVLGLLVVPTITGFTPASGSTGSAGSTTVTVTGSNFSATAANNTVMFGAVKATVSAATETQLTVTAPFGATWQPLSVTVGGKTAYSYSVANPFIPTFHSKYEIQSSDFSAKVDFTTLTAPYFVAIGDLDGDGKPDLAVANYSSNKVSLFRNTSTSGSIGKKSFAACVNYSMGTNPCGVAIGDLDGDGKPDLVITNFGAASFYVLRNTSTIGVINTTSFYGPIGFAMGTNPCGVAIGDLDGDGRPDLAVANNGTSTVSVLHNTSKVGSVNFAPRVDFTTGTSPRSVVIGDIDGDGKPDLAVANESSNTVSVLRNTTVVFGLIDAESFALKVDFETGTKPYSVAIGDLDGDGKPDLATANYDSNTVSVLQNTSASGTVSFALKVDLTVGTNPACVAICDLDGDGKPDLATANYTSGRVSVFRNTSTDGTIDTESFTSKVDFKTGTNPYCVAIGDLDGDGKPDLATANSASNTVSVLYKSSSKALFFIIP